MKVFPKKVGIVWLPELESGLEVWEASKRISPLSTPALRNPNDILARYYTDYLIGD